MQKNLHRYTNFAHENIILNSDMLIILKLPIENAVRLTFQCTAVG